MTPQLETRIATFLALSLAALGPALIATHPIVGAVCLALGTGLGGAYHIRTPADRASDRPPPPQP